MSTKSNRILLATILAAATVSFSGCTLFGFLDSIQVQVGGVTTTSYDFGSQPFGAASSPVTVTITNTGLFPLTLGGTSAVTVGGTATSDFTLSGSPGDTIPAGGSVSLTLTFTPKALGARSATVTIAPSGGGGSSTFTVTGTGGGSGTIAVSNVSNPSIINGGTVNQLYHSYGTNDNVFSITNNGTDTLYLTATPVVASSANAYVTISAQPGASVAPGDTTTFTVSYDTSSFVPFGNDSESVTVTIVSSDGADSTFTFTYDVSVNAG